MRRWLRARFAGVAVLTLGVSAACGESSGASTPQGEPTQPDPEKNPGPPEPPAYAEPPPVVPAATAPPPPEPSRPWQPKVACEPIEETGYEKGKGFPVTVIAIDGRLVAKRTARAYLAMQAAAAEDGVALPIYSGFRTQAEQQYFYDCYKTCSCNECARAARPGHSNHQSGRALDLGLWPGTEEWLKAHAKEFGFRRTVRKEPWHWEYRGGRRKLAAFPEPCATG